MDLSVSDASQTSLTRIADDKVLPFDTIVHNPSPTPGGHGFCLKTIKSIKSRL